MSAINFYRAFEEHHRGSRELISKRLGAYQPYIAPLRLLYTPTHAIDLGCGRGEWLELLQAQGFSPVGIDLDEGMLQACRDHNLQVVQGDAIAHLQSLADASQAVISGFHIAEHIPFNSLEILVTEGLRVLQPGGLLILETPNPENIVVGTSSFYLDPTHLRPIPPELLSFLPQYHGYVRVKIVRLQEASGIIERKDINLIEVFGGVSPDYAIIAQKAASPEILAHFDHAFGLEHGIQLNELAARFDAKNDSRFDALDQRLARTQAYAEKNTANLIDKLIDATSKAARSGALLEQLRQQHFNLEQQLAQKAEHAHHLASERDAILCSWSWRITLPLRGIAGLMLHPILNIKRATSQIVLGTIHLFRWHITQLMRPILRNPKWSYQINQYLMRYPVLHQQLLDVARQQGVLTANGTYVAPSTTVGICRDLHCVSTSSPRVNQIYNELKKAIKQHHEEKA